MKNEIWKPVVGYEGLYMVSSHGRVKSLKRTCIGKGGGLYPVPERVLRAVKNNKGYLHVSLCKDGKMKTHYVHRLVAAAFIPNPLGLPQVNHKDEQALNNAVSNLEWCTAEYNNNYGTRNERVGKVLSKPVLQFTREGELVQEWSSTKEAERLGGFQNQNISSCCSGKRKTHQGYTWKFKEAS